ncbi:MAG: CopG family antitoxin [Roseinatronobacter sp.]
MTTARHNETTCCSDLHEKNKKDLKLADLGTDQEAEAFLDQDLSTLDFTQFKPMRFETLQKSARVTMRLP